MMTLLERLIIAVMVLVALVIPIVIGVVVGLVVVNEVSARAWIPILATALTSTVMLLIEIVAAFLWISSAET